MSAAERPTMPSDPHAALEAALSRRDASGRTFRQRHPSHPAEVTSDRLLTAVERWHDKFDGEELDMIGRIRAALGEIADGER
jgi:hypothetical protein